MPSSLIFFAFIQDFDFQSRTLPSRLVLVQLQGSRVVRVMFGGRLPRLQYSRRCWRWPAWPTARSTSAWAGLDGVSRVIFFSMAGFLGLELLEVAARPPGFRPAGGSCRSCCRPLTADFIGARLVSAPPGGEVVLPGNESF